MWARILAILGYGFKTRERGFACLLIVGTRGQDKNISIGLQLMDRDYAQWL
jgi:hypothetical protein